MGPFAKPSRILHVVCAYWLRSSDWAFGPTKGQHASKMASPTAQLLKRMARPIAGLLIICSGSVEQAKAKSGYAAEGRTRVVGLEVVAVGEIINRYKGGE